ncbi:hypothetical protein IAT40_001095 [Kwoniella sp. CBS 6097]
MITTLADTHRRFILKSDSPCGLDPVLPSSVQCRPANPADGTGPLPNLTASHITTYDHNGKPYSLVSHPDLICNGRYQFQSKQARLNADGTVVDSTAQYIGVSYLQKRSPLIQFTGTLHYPQAKTEESDDKADDEARADSMGAGNMTGDAHSVNTVAMPDLSERYPQLTSSKDLDPFSNFEKIALTFSYDEPEDTATKALGLANPATQIMEGSIPVSSCSPQWESLDPSPVNVPEGLAEQYVPDLCDQSRPKVFWSNYVPSTIHSVSHGMTIRFLPTQSILKDSADGKAMDIMHVLYGGEAGIPVQAETSVLIQGREVPPSRRGSADSNGKPDVWKYKGWESDLHDWETNQYSPLPLQGESHIATSTDYTPSHTFTEQTNTVGRLDTDTKGKASTSPSSAAQDVDMVDSHKARQPRSRTAQSSKASPWLKWTAGLTPRSTSSDSSVSDKSKVTGGFGGWKRRRKK